MTQTPNNRSQALLLTFLTLSILAVPAGAGERDSDEPVAPRQFTWSGDCPQIKVLGSAGIGLLSPSQGGFLGVETSNLTPELRQHFGVPGEAGVMLSRVVEDSAAQAAGLAVGDIVTLVDGEGITSSNRLGRVIRHRQGGAAVEIEYWRDGQMHRTTATLEERERCTFDVGDYLHPINLDELPSFEGFAMDRETIENALKSARDAITSQDWAEHLKGFKEIDLERLEERMERVQERLRALEERLEREYGRDSERSERRRERDRERRESGHETAGQDGPI